jgi:hypothetical protein
MAMTDGRSQHEAATTSEYSPAASGQILLHRTRRLGWIAVLSGIMVLVPFTHPTTEAITQSAALLPLAMTVVLLGACASYRGIAAYIRSEDRRRADLVDAARRDGVALTANTVRHHIGNKLAVAVGYSEMLADDPRLPPDVQAHAHKVLTSAMAAAAVVHKLDEQLVRVELDTSVAGPPLLDLTASSQPLSQAETLRSCHAG